MWPGQSVKHRSIQELAPDSITACIADTYRDRSNPKTIPEGNNQLQRADTTSALPSGIGGNVLLVHPSWIPPSKATPTPKIVSVPGPAIPGGADGLNVVSGFGRSPMPWLPKPGIEVFPPKKTTARRLAGRCYSSFSICERLALRSPTPTQHCQTTEGQQADRGRLRNYKPDFGQTNVARTTKVGVISCTV